MTKLYELTEAFAEWVSMLEDCETPEEESEVMEKIEAINVSIAEKGEAYARILRNLQSDSAGYESEIKRMRKRKEVTDNAIERLKNNLIFAMGIAGATELHTSIGKWRIQKNPPKVQIIDASEVPIEFTEEQPRKVMNSLILKHWKYTGEIPEGCDIVIAEGVRFR